MDKAILGLAEAIEALRAELAAAMDMGQTQPMQFVVEPIELRLEATVTKDANGKIGWSVIGVGSSVGSATTQTLTLRLAPVWKNTDGTLVRDFTISNVQGPNEHGDHVGPRPGTIGS